MHITVELPDDIAQHKNPGREAIEVLVIEGYRSLTHHQAAQLLGFFRFEFDDFLTQRNISDRACAADDLKNDLSELERLKAQGLLGR
jgi:predicted HTH domain antitoxin